MSIFPFLTAPPDFANTPPVVRLVEPGLAWNTTFPAPDFLAENGSKIILRWEVSDTDAITSRTFCFARWPLSQPL